MNDIRTATRPATPWGTITAGFIAVLTALAVTVVHYTGVVVPLRAIGPGAIVLIGVAILAAGGFVVARSIVRDNRSHAAVPPAAPAAAPVETAPAPVLDEHRVDPVDGWLAEEAARLEAEQVSAEPAAETIQIPAEQGSAEGPPESTGDAESGREAQSNH